MPAYTLAQGADGRPTAERLRDPVLARFLVPQPVAGYLIGTGGARTKQYSERSGAKVWVAGQQFVDVPGMRCVPIIVLNLPRLAPSCHAVPCRSHYQSVYGLPPYMLALAWEACISTACS